MTAKMFKRYYYYIFMASSLSSEAWMTSMIPSLFSSFLLCICLGISCKVSKNNMACLFRAIPFEILREGRRVNQK